MGITKEELTELITTEEGKALVGEVAKALGFESQDDIKGLKLKNSQLIAVEKSYKEQLQTIKDQYADIDIEDYKAYQAGKGKKATPGDDIELRKIRQQLDQIAKEKDEYRAKLEGTTKKSSIHSAISKAGFDPRYGEALYALFERSAKVQQDSAGNYQVIIDDGNTVESIEDYALKYSKSDTGKAFLPVPDHKGAGAKSYSGSSQKTMRRSDWERLQGQDKIKAGREYQIID